MGPSGGGIYNFSGAAPLGQGDKKPFNFNLGGSGTGYPAQPTFGTVPGQSQTQIGGQQPGLGGTPFATGMQTSLGQAPQGLFGFASKPATTATQGGQVGATPNLFQNQASPGQTGQPRVGNMFGQQASYTFSPQAGASGQKPTSGTNLFQSGTGSNPPQPSLFSLPQSQNPTGLNQPQLPTAPSMQSRTGLQIGAGSPFSGGTQPPGTGPSLFNTPSSNFRGTGTALGTSTQPQGTGPALFSGSPFQGTGSALGIGTQPQGASSLLGIGPQPHGASSLLGMGVQPHGASSLLGMGAQPHGASSLLGMGVQPHGASSLLGMGVLPQGTGSALGIGAQPQGAGSLLGMGTQPQGTGSALGIGAQSQGAGSLLGMGVQPQGTGSALGMGVQPQGTGSALGIGAQPQGAGSLLGMGVQPQGTGSALGMGVQPQGTGSALGIGAQPQGAGSLLGMGVQPQGAGSLLGMGVQPQGTGSALSIGTQPQSAAMPSPGLQIGANSAAGIQLPQMFPSPQNKPPMTSFQPQITPQRLPQSTPATQNQSLLPQTLHISQLQTPGTQTPSSVTLPASVQAQPARPALFLLPGTQTPSSAPLVPLSSAVPSATQATQLPLTTISLPKPPQSAQTSTTTASSIPIVSLSTPSTSGLGSVTQTPAKKYTYRQLEDVINSWVMELDDQQKVFLNQAKQVNAWDLALLENEESIISLHDEVERAKTDQERLDHDLSSILNQQAELEEMLTPLEAYISTQPMHTSTQHADQERNKTYSMAEKIDGSMKDMLQSLREVLERINSVNAANSDRNNPISQITGILNAHMDSLLFIDESSNSLQQKLEELSRRLDCKKQDQEAKLKTAFN